MLKLQRILQRFQKAYPNSLLSQDARVLYANVLLSDHRPREVVALLEKDRSPFRTDLELLLGKAYEATGDLAKAAPILRNIYFTMPTSSEAVQAEGELKSLAAAAQLPPPSFSDLKTRADLLYRGRQYSQAVDEYRALENLADPSVKPAIQLALANALRRSGQDDQAKREFESIKSPSPEVEAERLYNLLELARHFGDEDGFLRLLQQLRETGPTTHLVGASPALRRQHVSAEAGLRSRH